MNKNSKIMPDFLGATVAGQAPDLGMPAELCLFEGILDPCTIVIFGASGDLTSRKLMPALYNLYLSGALPSPLIKECESCANLQELIHLYRAGSWGPEAAQPMISLILPRV